MESVVPNLCFILTVCISCSYCGCTEVAWPQDCCPGREPDSLCMCMAVWLPERLAYQPKVSCPYLAWHVTDPEWCCLLITGHLPSLSLSAPPLLRRSKLVISLFRKLMIIAFYPQERRKDCGELLLTWSLSHGEKDSESSLSAVFVTSCHWPRLLFLCQWSQWVLILPFNPSLNYHHDSVYFNC